MSNSEEADARNEAVQNVVEGAESWYSGSETDTVEEHLKDGFEQAGVDVPEQEIRELAEDIHENKDAQIEE